MGQIDIDAVELLIRQHRELEALLQKVRDEQDAARQCLLFAEVADQLTVHLKSEEEVFYPAVNAARTEDDLLESLEEHLSLKRLMADLLELEPDDRVFEPKFKVLKEQAEHHHKEEEEHLFPVVNRMLSGVERQELGRRMLNLQQSLRLQGEPRGRVMNETDSARPLE